MGAAVKSTELPWQLGFAEAVTVIETGALGLTVIVIAFDVAGFPITQPRLDVSTQVIISPFEGYPWYVELGGPSLTPLTFHW
jgi:hypothetical protein